MQLKQAGKANEIAAGIVLYNPDPVRLRQNISRILPQVSLLILIDNGSRNIDGIEAAYRSFSNVLLYKNGKNKGISAALNTIIHICEEKKITWALTLDQDSVCSEDLIEKYRPYTKYENAALLAARIVDINEDACSRAVPETEYDEIKRCITSGNLVNVPVCRQAGYFDEKMFIDYVDFDYCTRLIRAGYKIIRVNSAVLYHEIGHAKKITFFWRLGRLLHIKKFQKYYYTYNHSPARTYYYARNLIYYIRKHRGYVSAKKELAIFIKWLFLKIAFEDQKAKKFSAACRGLTDGLRIKVP